MKKRTNRTLKTRVKEKDEKMTPAGEVEPGKKVRLSRRQQEAFTRLLLICSIKKRIAVVRRRPFETSLPEVEDIVIQGESSEDATKGETYVVDGLPVAVLETEARIIEGELDELHSITPGEFYLLFPLDEEGLSRELKSRGSKPRARTKPAAPAIAVATV